jgi:hypothetical protein
MIMQKALMQLLAATLAAGVPVFADGADRREDHPPGDGGPMRNLINAVDRGAELLDRQPGPGWAHKVDVETLDVSEGYLCVLGQVFGSFTDGLRELELGSLFNNEAGDYGFDAPSGGDFDAACEELTLLWRNKINERQGSRHHPGGGEPMPDPSSHQVTPSPGPDAATTPFVPTVADKLIIVADNYQLAINYALEQGLPGHPGECWRYLYAEWQTAGLPWGGRYTIVSKGGLREGHFRVIDYLKRKGYKEAT